MSRLFVELYLDEDIDIRIAKMIRARDYRVTTAREASNLGFSDDEQLQYAVEKMLTLVTHNRDDFQGLANQNAAAGKDHFGIIVADLRSPPKPLSAW